MNDYERGWNAAIRQAVTEMIAYDGIPLMTPPGDPLFQLFFALKARVETLINRFPTEADL